MWQEIVDGVVNLFGGYGYIPMIALIIGLLLVVVELFLPGFGVFGITGTLLSAVGIAVRMVLGGTIIQLVIMLAFSLVVLIIAFLVMFVLAKLGILNFGIIQRKTSVPADYSKPKKEYRKLVGRVGFATTAFHPVGSFSYKDKVYEAVSTGEYIEKNSKVKVVSVNGDEIKVKKL